MDRRRGRETDFIYEMLYYMYEEADAISAGSAVRLRNFFNSRAENLKDNEGISCSAYYS